MPNLAAWISWAEAGLAIAFFAWLFELARRSLLSGSGEALRALSHGWRRFRLARAQVDLATTRRRIEKPYQSIAAMILAIFGALLGFMLVGGLAFNEFISENYPSNNFMFPRIPNHLVVHSSVSICVALLVVAYMRILSIEYDRLLNGDKRLSGLEKKIARLNSSKDEQSALRRRLDNIN